MVFVGFEKNPFRYGRLIHFACTIFYFLFIYFFFLQIPTRSAQYFQFSKFNELLKFFKVSPDHDDFLIF